MMKPIIEINNITLPSNNSRKAVSSFSKSQIVLPKITTEELNEGVSPTKKRNKERNQLPLF